MKFSKYYKRETIARVAIHEAGHAVVAELLHPNSVNIVKINTQPSLKLLLKYKYSLAVEKVTSMLNRNRKYGKNYELRPSGSTLIKNEVYDSLSDMDKAIITRAGATAAYIFEMDKGEQDRIKCVMEADSDNEVIASLITKMIKEENILYEKEMECRFDEIHSQIIKSTFKIVVENVEKISEVAMAIVEKQLLGEEVRSLMGQGV